MEKARENFKKLEEGDEESLKLWEFFREISLKEYKRIYDILGAKFDSYNGEAFYADKTDEVVDILEKKNVLEYSQGARIVNIDKDTPPCIVVKSNGSTIYATRDLAAILYRARTYDFYKAIYITGTEQQLHLKQVFEVAKYLVDEKYQKGLIHIPYGMIRLKTGKMSTREGTVVYIDDLINEAIEKSKKIILEKNGNLENIDLVAKQVGVGALIFNYLKTNKNKEIIFDLDETLRFDGETGPYVQYTYVRANAILKKAGFKIEEMAKIDYSLLKKQEEIDLAKILQKYSEIVKKAADEYEPSILARYLIEVSTLYSKFYAECSVILADNQNLRDARCALTYATTIILKSGLSILGIECPDRM
jgi:arginyl-tRNA synthetase